MDFVEITLLILLGSAVAFLIDSVFGFTPWLAKRIVKDAESSD